MNELERGQVDWLSACGTQACLSWRAGATNLTFAPSPVPGEHFHL